MSTVGLCVLAKDAFDAHSFRAKHSDLIIDDLCVVEDDGSHPGLGVVGDRYFRTSSCDVVGLVHADVVLGPGAVESLARCVLGGAVSGIVGRASDSVMVLAREAVIHRNLDGSPLYSRGGGGEVDILDSCSVFIKRIRYGHDFAFDLKTFDGFHFCVEDLCLQAYLAGIPSIVPPCNAIHRGSMTMSSARASWMRDHAVYQQRLVDKYEGMKIVRT